MGNICGATCRVRLRYGVIRGEPVNKRTDQKGEQWDVSIGSETEMKSSNRQDHKLVHA